MVRRGLEPRHSGARQARCLSDHEGRRHWTTAVAAGGGVEESSSSMAARVGLRLGGVRCWRSGHAGRQEWNTAGDQAGVWVIHTWPEAHGSRRGPIAWCGPAASTAAARRVTQHPCRRSTAGPAVPRSHRVVKRLAVLRPRGTTDSPLAAAERRVVLRPRGSDGWASDRGGATGSPLTAGSGGGPPTAGVDGRSSDCVGATGAPPTADQACGGDRSDGWPDPHVRYSLGRSRRAPGAREALIPGVSRGCHLGGGPHARASCGGWRTRGLVAVPAASPHGSVSGPMS